MLLDDVAGEGLADIARPVIGRHLIQETTVQNAWGDVVGDMWVSRPGPPRSGPCRAVGFEDDVEVLLAAQLWRRRILGVAVQVEIDSCV